MFKKLLVPICIVLSFIMLTGCGSEEKEAMDATVTEANALLAEGEEPYDVTTKDNLEEAVASADDAKEDSEYVEVTTAINEASKAYEDSIKQLKQVTTPEESFLIERLQAVESATEVEAATEETDVNNLMNKAGGYYAYVAMKSSLVDDDYYSSMSAVESGCGGGAVIEAFKTTDEANTRNEYLAAFDGNAMFSPGSHTVVGTLVIRTSDSLTATEQKELEQAIIDSLIRLD